jgi:16S rRNA processing protein RimM
VDVVVGRVAKAHGLTGEVAVEVRTDSPDERFAAGAAVSASHRRGQLRRLTVAASRPHGARLLVRFEEVSGREEAERLRGALLTTPTSALPPTEDPDEFYDHELAGLAAELVDGTPVGTVREVVHTPGGDLLALDCDGREVLAPFVKAIVTSVDLAGGKVVLDPPEGLLE